MQRWYMLRQSKGNPQNQKGYIQSFLQNNRLSDIVPRFSIEKNAGLNGRPVCEFYLLLTIESDSEGQVPWELDNFLKSNYAGRLVKNYEIKRYKDFEGFLSKEVETQNLAYYIKYRPQVEEEDPQDLYQTHLPSRISRSPKELEDRTEKMDKLLYWVSAMGNGSWEAFKKTCSVLGLEEQTAEARRILRRFQLLGHLNLQAAGKHWVALPPTLIEIAPEEFCLIGQRTFNWVSLLKMFRSHFGELSFEFQPEGNGTSYIRFKGLTAATLLEKFNHFGIFSGIQINTAGSSQIPKNLPDLTEWKDSLSTTEGIVTALYDVEKYTGLEFKPDSFRGESGMYRLRHIKTGEVKGQAYTFYYDAATQRWLRGDWYGLRFLSYQKSGTAPETKQVVYWNNEKELAIAEAWRWPEFYERILVLSSGKLPERRGNNLYYSASRDVAFSLATKLGLEFKEN